jgi:ribose transport system substrate-binding protein
MSTTDGPDHDSSQRAAARLRRRRPLIAAVAAGAVALLAVAGCSSSTNASSDPASTTSSAAGDDAGLAAAKAAVQPFLSEPTKIGPSEPLGSAPPKKVIGQVNCAEPTCALLSGYLEQAAGALGWKVVSVTATATDPGAAIQQLIDAGVNYVVETAYTSDTFRQQMAELKQKQIPLFEVASTDVPQGPVNDIYGDIMDASAQAQWGRLESDWAIVDSGGKADVVTVNIPSYPVLAAQSQAEKAEFTKNCPSCRFNELDVTLNDLTSGQIPQDVVSYLQSNPSVNYIQFTDPQDEAGLVSALRSAGLLSKVKIYGSAAQAGQFKEIADGASAAWQIAPQPYIQWAVVDQMARLAAGKWTVAEERAAALVPWFLLTNTTTAAKFAASTNPYPWPGPGNYQAAFKAMWGV